MQRIKKSYLKRAKGERRKTSSDIFIEDIEQRKERRNREIFQDKRVNSKRGVKGGRGQNKKRCGFSERN